MARRGCGMCQTDCRLQMERSGGEEKTDGGKPDWKVLRWQDEGGQRGVPARPGGMPVRGMGGPIHFIPPPGHGAPPRAMHFWASRTGRQRHPSARTIRAASMPSGTGQPARCLPSRFIARCASAPARRMQVGLRCARSASLACPGVRCARLHGAFGGLGGGPGGATAGASASADEASFCPLLAAVNWLPRKSRQGEEKGSADSGRIAVPVLSCRHGAPPTSLACPRRKKPGPQRATHAGLRSVVKCVVIGGCVNRSLLVFGILGHFSVR
jgi:hypothetical protein